MKKVIRLTESDLATIVRRVINENKIQNNTRYYSNRNLRRLGRTPIVMVESIEDYRPLLNEGIIDTVKEKITSFFEKSKDLFKEKTESMINSVEDYFDNDIDNITLDNVKSKLKDELPEEDLNEEDESFTKKWRNADIGDNTSEAGRPFQKAMRIIQDIFGINVLSFGLLGSWLQSFFVAIPNSWVTHTLVSLLAMLVIIWIRKLVALKTGHKYSDKKDKEVKENFRIKYRR
jgi:hypothetical protein